ncbi:uncharacterized protein LOC113330937 isoform X1 [Papaver somniferum]|uniref:uncharacterized protein LOC113330937 isoform X1 n=2 Tax=Papaver somniferum TaxID=3469 RepID=UPI000E6FE2FC|nr:uncharacterized protein LOC113330937 isoform X1 [Papaver somniferum]
MFCSSAMHRSALMHSYSVYSHRSQEIWAWLLIPFTLWICVSVSVRYGAYGNSNLPFGPNSSRLFKASSIFVQQIQVKDDWKTGVSVYGFSEEPELSLNVNCWNFSRFLHVRPYRRQGFSLWLNKGSMIQMKWAADVSDFNDILVVLYKGQHNFATLEPVTAPPGSIFSSNSTDGTSRRTQVKYLIDEGDNYYICVINMKARPIVMKIDVNVSSTMYDITKANNKCSTVNGLCQLNLLFPKEQFLVLATPNNGDINGWYIELSFVARVITYIAILGLLVIFLSLILKYILAWETSRDIEPIPELRSANETDPLIPPTAGKPGSFIYGTGDEDDLESQTSNSSDDLYDGKICVICYDKQRNCFFIPCGHCAACYPCAQRIVSEGESRFCPVCRRLIHRIRKLYNS